VLFVTITFRDDHLVAIQIAADLMADRIDGVEVWRSVAVGGRAHGDEYDLGAANRIADICGEEEPPLGDATRDFFPQAGLVEGNLTMLERGDLLLVDVGTDNGEAEFRKTGS